MVCVWYGHFKSILGLTAKETVDKSNIQEYDVSEETNHFLTMR